MRRRAFLGVLVGTALGSPLLTRAQEKTKRIIGFLTGSPLPAANAPKTAFSAAFHTGLKEIGYVKGENRPGLIDARDMPGGRQLRQALKNHSWSEADFQHPVICLDLKKGRLPRRRNRHSCGP